MSGVSTATALTVGAAVIGAGVTAYGIHEQGVASNNAAKYNSEVAANNAKISTQNAAYAGAEGDQNTAVAQMKTRAEIGAIKASQAASGVDVNSGSAVDVRSSAAETGELNAINIRSEAARKAYGYQTEAAGYSGQSGLDKSAANNAEAAGDIGAGASIIGGLGKAGEDYTKYGAGNSVNTSDNDEFFSDMLPEE